MKTRSHRHWAWCALAPIILIGDVRESAHGHILPVSAAKSGTETKVASLWTRTAGEDWPSFLGSHRDSCSSETGLITDWTKEPLRIVWQRESGVGHSAGAIDRGRYFHFERVGDMARVVCLHAESGAELWHFEYPTDFVDMYKYDGGPRSTPIVDGDRVYTIGAEGMLHCLRVDDGAVIWKCDTVKQFSIVKNFFGVGSSPIIDDDLLIAMVGGSPPADQQVPDGQLDRVHGNGTGIVAFDKFSGVVRYAVTNELASYSSPVIAHVDGHETGVALCRDSLIAFEPHTGRIDFRLPWRSELIESVNASTPVVHDNEVLIGEAYGPGSCMLAFQPTGYQFLWRDLHSGRGKILQPQFDTPVFYQDHAYACSGRYVPQMELRCIDWKTGKIMWRERTGQRSSRLEVDGFLINLQERGTLQLIRANPLKYELVAECVLQSEAGGSDGTPAAPLLTFPCWTAPVLSHGLLYLRGKDRLVCVELIRDR